MSLQRWFHVIDKTFGVKGNNLTKYCHALPKYVLPELLLDSKLCLKRNLCNWLSTVKRFGAISSLPRPPTACILSGGAGEAPESLFQKQAFLFIISYPSVSKCLASLLGWVYSGWCKSILQVLGERSALSASQLMFYSIAALGRIWHLYNGFPSDYCQNRRLQAMSLLT